MKKTNGLKTVIAIIMIILAVILLKQGGFLASVITTCDNYEPTSINDYQNYFENANSTWHDSGNIIVNDNITLKKYGTPYMNTEFINLENHTCNNIINILIESDNTSSKIRISNHEVNIINNKFYYCNDDKKVLIYCSELISINDYYDEFETCLSQEVNDQTNVYVQSEEICVEARGVWNGEYCICTSNNQKLLIGEENCPEESTTSTSSSSTTTSTTETTSTTPTTKKDNNKTLIILSGILIILGYYFFYEKGPTKGLIRKRKKR